MKRAWCRIHGQANHMHREACGCCGTLFTFFGQRACPPTCHGPSFKTWLKADEDQRTWKCVEQVRVAAAAA